MKECTLKCPARLPRASEGKRMNLSDTSRVLRPLCIFQQIFSFLKPELLLLRTTKDAFQAGIKQLRFFPLECFQCSEAAVEVERLRLGTS